MHDLPHTQENQYLGQVVTQKSKAPLQPVQVMTPISFKNLLIHLAFDKIDSDAWIATATIEDPINSETAAVALPNVHRTRQAAGMQILRESRVRILRGIWRN